MVRIIKNVSVLIIAYTIGWVLGATVLWGVWNIGSSLFGYGGITIAQAAIVSLLADFLYVFIGRRPW